MNKICTSLEQSKKLIELGIDISSSDMVYLRDYFEEPGEYNLLIGSYHEGYAEQDDGTLIPVFEEHIPAWSLSALLELMPIETHLYKMQDEDNYTKHYYKVGSFDGKGWIELNNTSAIDAVYEMVCWLKENKKI